MQKPTQGWDGLRAAVATGALLLIAGIAVSACGKSHPANATGDGIGPSGPSDLCTDTGATRPCHVLLSQGAGYSNCMAGTQTCDGTIWGACAAGGTMGTAYGAALTSSIPKGVGGRPKAVLNGAAEGIHTLDDPTPASAAATLCAADPCDPYCFGWDDVGTGSESTPPNPTGDYSVLPGGAQVNFSPCKTGTSSAAYAGHCQYDTCCFQNGKQCVDFTSSNSGRCVQPPIGDTFGSAGQAGGGNCAAGVDFTAGVACDDASGTNLTICNRGGVDFNGVLKVGFKSGGNPKVFPFSPTVGGCSINFALIPGGLAKDTCGALNPSGTAVGSKWNGIPLAGAVDCSSLGATPAARQTALSGNGPIYLNPGGAGFTASSVTNISVPECNSSNNWSFSNHDACILPPANNVVAPIATLTFGNINVTPCSIGTTQADAKKCQYDTCCAVALVCLDWRSAAPTVLGGMCDPANAAGTASLVAIAGATSVGNCSTSPDYTVSVGCNVGVSKKLTDRHFQVCNRGAVASPAAGLLHVGIGDDGTSAGSYPFMSDGECILNLATIGALAANTCGDLDAVEGTFNGATAGVNCNSIGTDADDRNDFFDGTDRAVRINGHPNSTGDGDNTLVECDGANNWSFRHQGLDCSAGSMPAPPPPTPYTYTAKCQPGYHSRWKWLSYKLSPGGGDVKFSATLALTDLATGVLGVPGAAITVADPPVSPTFAQCDYVTNNPPCPVNLGDPARPAPKFNTLQSVSDTMILTITPNGQAFATNWGLAYDCVPYE